MTSNLRFFWPIGAINLTFHLIPVSGPVTDLQTNSPDNSTLVVSWRPPTTPKGNIISYTVRIENLRDGTTLRNIMNHNAVTTNFTENDLGTLLYTYVV